MTVVLRTESVRRRFGGLIALESVDLEVEAGTVHAIIGPNGAGKTTLVNVCTGVLAPTSGRIWLGNKEIDGRSPSEINRAGAARTFQNLSLFTDATVMENILVGAETRSKAGFLGTLLGSTKARRGFEEASATAVHLLDFVGLKRRSADRAGTLPYGSQKLLEMARALATRPVILFLDEPGAGMNDEEMNILRDLIQRIREDGLAIVLIEHNMPFVMSIADKVSVLNFGEKIAEGSPKEVAESPEVIDAYLGIDDQEGDER